MNRTLFRCCGLVVLGLTGVSFPVAGEEFPADPAAHTVIVPFDASKPVSEAAPERYYLDYEAFQKLWNLAKEARRPEEAKPGATGAGVNLALHEVEIRENRLVVASRLRAVSMGYWQTLRLESSVDGGGGDGLDPGREGGSVA